MSKHTPGPWFVNEQASTGREDETDVRVDSADGPIAYPLGEDCYANARLIAAAPDLLAFVEQIASGKAIVGVVDHARALLARIEGKD